MADPFIGEIRMFGGNFPPRGWAYCDGQLLAVSQNDALFSLFGTIYGGDGRTTFGVPDLRGRVPMHYGTGPGLAARNIGARSGSENVTITTQTLPAHSHAVSAANDTVSETQPTGNMTAKDAAVSNYRNAAIPGPQFLQAMNSQMVVATGGGQQHNNVMPFLAVHFIVALTGIYPSRS